MASVVLQTIDRPGAGTQTLDFATRMNMQLHASGCSSGDPREVRDALQDAKPSEVRSFVFELSDVDRSTLVDILASGSTDVRGDAMREFAKKAFAIDCIALLEATNDPDLSREFAEQYARHASVPQKAFFLLAMAPQASDQPAQTGNALTGTHTRPDAAATAVAVVLASIHDDAELSEALTSEPLRESLELVLRAAIDKRTQAGLFVTDWTTRDPQLLLRILENARGTTPEARAELARVTSKVLKTEDEALPKNPTSNDLRLWDQFGAIDIALDLIRPEPDETTP